MRLGYKRKEKRKRDLGIFSTVTESQQSPLLLLKPELEGFSSCCHAPMTRQVLGSLEVSLGDIRRHMVNSLPVWWYLKFQFSLINLLRFTFLSQQKAEPWILSRFMVAQQKQKSEVYLLHLTGIWNFCSSSIKTISLDDLNIQPSLRTFTVGNDGGMQLGRITEVKILYALNARQKNPDII